MPSFWLHRKKGLTARRRANGRSRDGAKPRTNDDHMNASLASSDVSIDTSTETRSLNGQVDDFNDGTNTASGSVDNLNPCAVLPMDIMVGSKPVAIVNSETASENLGAKMKEMQLNAENPSSIHPNATTDKLHKAYSAPKLSDGRNGNTTTEYLGSEHELKSASTMLNLFNKLKPSSEDKEHVSSYTSSTNGSNGIDVTSHVRRGSEANSVRANNEEANASALPIIVLDNIDGLRDEADSQLRRNSMTNQKADSRSRSNSGRRNNGDERPPVSVSPSKQKQSKFSFPSVGGGSSESISTFKSLGRLKRKTVSRLFSNDQPETPIIDDCEEHLHEQQQQSDDISESTSADEFTDSSPAEPESSNSHMKRPFPMIRSISSRSQETRMTSSPEEEAKNSRPRSKTLNSLVQENLRASSVGQGGGPANVNNNFGMLFGGSSSGNNKAIIGRSPSASQSNLLLNKSLPEQEIETVECTENETPQAFLERLLETRLRSTIAVILSRSDTAIYMDALQAYVDLFDFKDDPIDMALRKFLMHVQLPKEAQQIDRVLECFAQTYFTQNPDIYLTKEDAYIVAFSLMILHTDYFNQNNRYKMQKSEYIRNTSAKCVPTEVLECFYDNITYTQFIHTDEDVTQAASAGVKHWTRRSSSFGRNNRDMIDPYYLLLEGRLDALRPSLGTVLNLEDTYSFNQVESIEEFQTIRDEFRHGPCIQLVSQRSRPEAFLTADSLEDPASGVPGIVDIKVVKVGLLYRRENKRMIYSRNTWREWGALLTASQLYLFKDAYWVKSSILAQNITDGDTTQGRLIRAPIDGFHPSAVISTVDMAALFHKNEDINQNHAFLLVGRGGAQDWMAADSEEEMLDWMKKINFASSFNTYHVGIYGMSKTDEYVEKKSRIISEMQKSPLLFDGDDTKSESRGSSLEIDLNSNDSTEDDIMPPDTSKVDDKNDPSAAVDEITSHQLRFQAVTQKLEEMYAKLRRLSEQISEYTHAGKHLKLLAPIQQRTRESVIFAAGRLAAKLDWNWLDYNRLLCYKQLFELEKIVESQLAGGRTDIGEPSDLTSIASANFASLTNVHSGHSSSIHAIESTPSLGRLESPSIISSPDDIDANMTAKHEGSIYYDTQDGHLSETATDSNASLVESVLSYTESVSAQDVAPPQAVKLSPKRDGSIKATGSFKSNSSKAAAGRKNFQYMSLRDGKSSRGSMKDHSSTTDKDPTTATADLQRSTSLMREDGGDFTLHGKKFSVVEVNPDFAATPNVQRRSVSQIHRLDSPLEMRKAESLPLSHEENKEV